MPACHSHICQPVLHWGRGAARRVRSHIPGALSILTGAVPVRARGLGHMAPTYFRREPGIDAPTAIAAPHSFTASWARCGCGLVGWVEFFTRPNDSPAEALGLAKRSTQP